MKIINITLIVFFSFLHTPSLLSQEFIQTKKIDSVYFSLHLDSLKLKYAFNKRIPDTYSLPILITLSYFPELSQTKIIFRNTNIKTTLNVRPTTLSVLFKNRLNRKYIIRINSMYKDSLINLKDVPFNASIGLFGHEFNHIIDYRNSNVLQIIKRLVEYSNNKKKAEYERQVDYMTINRGLGWQLYDWSYFVLYKSMADKKYKNYKRSYYLSPNEIIGIIQR